MKGIMKKLFFLISVLVLLFSGVVVFAEEVKIPEYGGSGYLIYEGTSNYITIDTDYNYEEFQFRGVWVSNFAGDISNYSTEEQFKKDMTAVLDNMEYYHLNALIFRVRTHNNALYDSKLNPRASFWSKVDFNTFDPLEWLINETHKRGIEFHAWMNPYRVASSSNTYKTGTIPQSNPQNNPDNLLKNSSTTILDPGKEVVKSFVINTCLELVNKYDVDAIHFDDYFYIEDCDDSKTYAENNPNGLNKADWRRENINDFVRRLSKQLKAYNERTGKSVQLGISPTGTWQNGNGKVTYDENGIAVTNGSLGTGNASYGEYLYCDSKNWVDNEYLDYLCPQVYHDMQNGWFAETSTWWNDISKNSKTNMYIGIGFYGPTNNWKDPDEFYNEMHYLNKLENIKGIAIYCYKTIKNAKSGSNKNKQTQINKIYDEVFAKDCYLPVLRRYDYAKLGSIDNLVLTKSEDKVNLTFDKLDGARFYIVYKDEVNLNNLLVQTSGEVNDNKVTITLDSVDATKYIVVPLSYNNEFGESKEISKDDVTYIVEFVSENGELLKTDYTNNGKVNVPSFDIDYEKYEVEFSCDLDKITGNTTITVKFIEKIKYVNVEYLDGDNLVKKEFVFSENLENEVKEFIPEVVGKSYKELVQVDDENYKVEYEVNKYIVNFLDEKGDVFNTQTVEYGAKPEYPNHEFDGYKFNGWDYLDVITIDIDIKPILVKLHKVTFVNEDNETIKELEVENEETINLSEIISGEYEFYLNENSVTGSVKVTSDLIIKVVEKKNIEEPIIVDKSGCNAQSIINIIYMINIFGALLILRKRW